MLPHKESITSKQRFELSTGIRTTFHVKIGGLHSCQTALAAYHCKWGCRDLEIGITFSSDSGTLQLFLRCHCMGLMCSQPRGSCFSVAVNKPIRDMN